MTIHKNGKIVIANADSIELNILSVLSKPENGVLLGNGDYTFSWQDLIGNVRPDDAHPSTSPVLETFIGDVRAYTFAVNKLSDIEYHIPHDYALGTDMYIHVHWSHTCDTIADTIAFQLNFTTAPRTYNPTTSFVSAETQTVSVTGLSETDYPQYGHNVNEIQLSTSGGGTGYLDTDELEVDGVILVNLEQITLPTLGTPAVNTVALPYILTVDIHYQSTGVGTKSSAPDYYT